MPVSFPGTTISIKGSLLIDLATGLAYEYPWPLFLELNPEKGGVGFSAAVAVLAFHIGIRFRVVLIGIDDAPVTRFCNLRCAIFVF